MRLTLLGIPTLVRQHLCNETPRSLALCNMPKYNKVARNLAMALACPCSTLNGAYYPGGHYWDYYPGSISLTHWGRVMHICVGSLTVIGSDNGLSPGRRQAIIWTSDGTVLIGPLGTNFSEILVELYIFSFKKMHLKLSWGNWRPFCLGLNVLSQVTAAHLIIENPCI